jgi:hypothetical protein
VALQAVGTVPQISGVGVPVDGAIIGDLEGTCSSAIRGLTALTPI